jgi:DNA-binding CsgD family transcriptional regulator
MIDADFDRHFAEALRLHRMTPTPFERARTELAWGTRLRRAGRRREARTHMDAALSTFGALRAHPWTRLTGEELGAAGGPVPGEGWDGVEGLSPREMQVARAVAEGATNREVAARLFLSEKTVEHHLGNIFRKLGLRSRTQLVARIVGSSVHLTADAAGTHASDPGSEAAAGRA